MPAYRDRRGPMQIFLWYYKFRRLYLYLVHSVWRSKKKKNIYFFAARKIRLPIKFGRSLSIRPVLSFPPLDESSSIELMFAITRQSSHYRPSNFAVDDVWFLAELDPRPPFVTGLFRREDSGIYSQVRRRAI